MNKEYILDSQAQEERVNKRFQEALDKFSTYNKCDDCGGHPSIIVEDEAYCSKCIENHASWCKEDKRYYLINEIETCAHCEETYHINYIDKVEDGNHICYNCKEEYKRQMDDSNYPEYDDRESYSRF